MSSRITLTELGRQIDPAIPAWKLRRVVDALAAKSKITIQRAGLYRTFSTEDIGIVTDALRRREAATC